MKILCITPVRHIGGVYDKLASCGEMYYYPVVAKDECLQVIRRINPEIIFTNPNKMKFILGGEFLDGVKIVCTASTGTNHIDMEYCKNNSIQVISLTTDFETIEKISSTAEMAFALTMSLIRKIPSAFDSVKRMKWDYVPYIGRQMDSLSVGVIGFGRLGSMYAKYCEAFGMDVYVCDPYNMASKYPIIEMEEALKTCDVVSLHVHLDKETKHLIHRGMKLKYGLFLINTSRGGVVDEQFIIESLKDKSLGGYATDVVEDELHDVSHSPLIQAAQTYRNLIITPHIGGMTREAQEIAYNRVADVLKETIS